MVAGHSSSGLSGDLDSWFRLRRLWLEFNALLELVERQGASDRLGSALGVAGAASRESLVGHAVEALLDGTASDGLVRALERASERAPDSAAALTAVAQLIVTSPEYHLI